MAKRDEGEGPAVPGPWAGSGRSRRPGPAEVSLSQDHLPFRAALGRASGMDCGMPRCLWCRALGDGPGIFGGGTRGFTRCLPGTAPYTALRPPESPRDFQGLLQIPGSVCPWTAREDLLVIL